MTKNRDIMLMAIGVRIIKNKRAQRAL